VIDGQQRMTTLQVALAAVRDLCVGPAEAYHESWHRLTQNHVIFGGGGADEPFKVWPTMVDRDHFRHAMTAGSAAELTRLYASPELLDHKDHLIPQAYLYFSEQAATWLGDLAGVELGDRMKALYTAVNNDLHVVVIDLESDDDAQLIFQTLNALGAPLLPGDLVKNYLFHQAEAQGLNAEELHADFWRPIDDEALFWREEVRQGRLTRPKIDLFFQHFLTLRTREDVGATHLFPAFREFAEKRPDLSPKQHLADIRTFSRIYKRFEEFPRTSPEGVFFYRLEQLDTTTVLPLLLEIFRRLDTVELRPQLLRVLADVESFLVRRSVCCLTTKAYNRIFLDILQALDTEVSATADSLRELLLRSDAPTNRWPDDGEFSSALLDAPLYTVLVRKRLRMLLEALEMGIRTAKSEVVALPSDLTVEHLMPQSWKEHWPLPNVEPHDKEASSRERFVHTLGNLTLLTRKLNPSVSNAAWASKREAIFEHSGLMMNRQLYTFSEWHEGAILQRGIDLTKVALTLWPRPTVGVAT
jgi:hypothetical protein